MNKKLIAAAVSAAVVAPVAAYGEVTVYGRINNAIDLNDLAGDSKTDLSGVSSRFGVKYNKDMGNGFSAHGKYEFSTSSDKEEEGINDIRVATVGISGPFGRIDAGNQWSAYFNTFGTLVSPTYTLGYYLYSSVGGAPYRASNTIKYSNSFGPVYLELDVRLNESDEGSDVAEEIRGDGLGLGLSFAVTDNFTIAAAFDSEDGENGANARPDADRIGIAVKANFGSYWASLGRQSHETDDDATDIDTTLLYGGGPFFSEKTNWLVGYSRADNDNAASGVDDPEQLTWGVYRNLGGGLKLYYEATDVDNESASQDGRRHLIGMRVDF